MGVVICKQKNTLLNFIIEFTNSAMHYSLVNIYVVHEKYQNQFVNRCSLKRELFLFNKEKFHECEMHLDETQDFSCRRSSFALRFEASDALPLKSRPSFWRGYKKKIVFCQFHSFWECLKQIVQKRMVRKFWSFL